MILNPDFYPTPPEVITSMIAGLDMLDKVVLEPSAGSGNIIDQVKELGAKVICCEQSEDLAQIVKTKADFIGYDFLEVTSDQVSHVDYIIMNPPFSKDVEHIMHAWDIAPAGCVIKALCNYQSIDNQYSRNRRQMSITVRDNGFYENLGDVFSNAERKTDVEVGLVTLFKPKTGEDEFEGYFDFSEDEEYQENGIIQYNEIREIVNRYVAAVRMFDEVEAMSNKINDLASVFSSFSNLKFGAHSTDSNNRYQQITRDVYKKDLQKGAWRTVFSKMKMDKYVTKSVKDHLNKFVEQNEKVPFTMKNVYKMIDMIVQTHSGRMDGVILEVFEKFTKHYHDNRYALEGWKTNSHYILNKKIIVPYVTEIGYGGKLSIGYRSNAEMIDDLVKALCYLTGTNYSNVSTLRDFVLNATITDPEHYRSAEKIALHGKKYEGYLRNGFASASTTKEEWVNDQIESEVRNMPDKVEREFGKWHEWDFFRIKGFKKGTLHMEFKDESVWAKLNQRVAKIKGFPLPEKL